MALYVRPSLIGLPSYAAGRKVPGAAPLDSNECPYGLLPAVAARLARAAPAASRYPDMACAALVEALAAHHGVAAERIAVGAGSTEVCSQLLHAMVSPGDEVIFGWRSFEAYPLLTEVAGGTPVRVPLHEYTLALDAMLASVTRRTRLIFACNPNNPTGTAAGAEDLRRFLAAVPDDILVVIDEAYRQYADPALVPDAFDLAGERRNVVVLRTFSKAYALAGLRVGYCLGAAEVIRQVRKAQVPFSVGTTAQDAAVAALGETAEVTRRVRLTVAERDRVTARLRELGYDVPRSQANFFWLPLGPDSAGFAGQCLAGGVATRAFQGEGVRVTVGLPQENDLFLELAEKLR
jgi:histidinol-phosphate aminotransferase